MAPLTIRATWSPRRPLHQGRVKTLEGDAFRIDRTLSRVSPDDLDGYRDVRAVLTEFKVAPTGVLAYEALADGPYGRYRVVALLIPVSEGAMTPLVMCLDGPRGPEASEHRYDDMCLCLYYHHDPPERRWKEEDGVLRLFDLARRHLLSEHMWRQTGRWPVDEAPHGETPPAPANPALALPAPHRPGRNEPCPCGSGLKAKRCCFR
jgi:SEC-C motif